MQILHANCDYIWTPLHQLMIHGLNAIGIQNAVFSPVYSKDGALIELSENEIVCKCFNKNDRFFFNYKQGKIIEAFENEFSSKVKDGEYDVFHAYYLFTDGNYIRKMALKYGVPYVVAVRNTDVNVFFKWRPYLRHVGINVLRDAQKVFFLSEAYKKSVIENYVPKHYREDILNKSIVIPNGIDDFWLRNRFENKDYSEVLGRLEKKQVRLIYAGVVDKNKNLELTIKAISRLINDGWDVHFDVVGPVRNKAILRDIRKAPFVYYTQKIPKEKLIEKYRASDIFVMPSHKESFGLVYAEAMSQGLPVIYTRGQGFDGHFADGEVGYSISDRSEKELIDAIIKCTWNYNELSKNALNSVQKFNWNFICREYKEIYAEICGGR